jgi:hypothetical protein
MTANQDERTPLRAEDEEFVERLAARFSPEPLSPARRAAFDDALAARIARRRHRWLLVPALATAAVAAALAWLVAPGAFDPAKIGPANGDDVIAETTADTLWELELLDPNAFVERDEADDLEQLPDDYAAIAVVFLDG